MENPDRSIEQISQRLRDVRQKRGFSQTRLGEKVGVSAEVIQKIEAGNSMQPRCIMELGEALGVNPAWLQFGEPWARKKLPTKPGWLKKEKPTTTRTGSKVVHVNDSTDFTGWLSFADQVINAASKDQLAEAARLLALNLAHYQNRFGEMPLENFAQLMKTQEIDQETARLVSTAMESLIGVLGLVIAQAGCANDPLQ